MTDDRTPTGDQPDECVYCRDCAADLFDLDDEEADHG